MLIVLPEAVPDAGAPLSDDDAGAVSVTVLVSPPQAATPIASANAAIGMMSRFSDMVVPRFGCGTRKRRPSVPCLRPLEENRAQHDRALRDLLDLGGQVELRHQAE